MPDETKRLVKPVRRGSLPTARKRHLVTSGFATPIERKLHHLLSNTPALMFDGDHHIFNQTRGSAPVRQILHDQQREGPDHLLVKTSNVKFVVWIVPKPSKSRPHLRNAEDIAVVDFWLCIQCQNSWEIIFKRLMYDNRVHGFGEQYYSDKVTLSLDVFCREKPKSKGLVSSRHPDFAGMMRPGHDQSTSFGLSAVGRNCRKKAQKAQR